MRTIRSFIMLFILLVPSLASAGDPGLMRLGLVEGGVQVQIQDTTDWTDATVNVPLDEGDRLWVPEGGKAEVQVRGGVLARTDGGTALDILHADREAAQFYLDRGHAYFNNRRGGIRIVQADTPLASVRSYDNSVLMLDVLEDGTTEVSVLKGRVTVESRAGATQVSAGKTLTVRSNRDAELAPVGPADEWELWNRSRDGKLTAAGESGRHLPEELHEFASDLDGHGSWSYDGEHGYVWLPLAAGPAWAPYTAGRWVWVRGGYVWISYDPWGWAPFHYGRWIFLAGRGWCWVPPATGAAYWGPGYVGWIVTPAYVSWVPLAPGEIFYGYGNFGPSSVNLTTVVVSPVVVNRVYVNARHGHAVTVVDRRSFGTGTRVPVKDAGNPFIDKKHRRDRDIAVAPPPERPARPVVLVPPDKDQVPTRPPEREHARREYPDRRQERMPDRPIVGTGSKHPAPPAPQAVPERRPPDRVRATRPATVKQERRLARERDASAFRQQQPPNLPVKQSKDPRPISRPPQKQPSGQKDRKERGEKHDGR